MHNDVQVTVMMGPDFKSVSQLQKTGEVASGLIGLENVAKLVNYEKQNLARSQQMAKEHPSKEKAPKQAAKERGGKAL